jgi:putative nucleotidyltransferase with HDIG domain
LQDLSSKIQIQYDGLLLYAAAVAAFASATAAVMVAAGVPLGDPWAVVCLAAVAALAERGSVRLSSTTEVSISFVPAVFAAILFGPLAALVVGAASNLSDLGDRSTDRPGLKWLTYTSTRAITGAYTGTVAWAIREVFGTGVTGVAIATTVCVVASEALDTCFAGLTRKIRRNGQMRDVFAATVPLILASVSLYGPVVALLVVAYEQVSPWTLPLFLIPSLAAQRLLILYQGERRLTYDLSAVNDRLERANLSFASALVATLDARDRYTAGHSAAVARYARDIAARMGLSQEEQELAHLCGLVHDIGKVGLPPGLLEKRGPLTLDERRQMEDHAAIGERILANVDDYTEIARIVRHHHERVDGLGYPDRLRSDEIPVLSRIIAVADAYDAMTSDRPYREAMPSRVARHRLAQAVESQFDTNVVAAFEAILAGETVRLQPHRDQVNDLTAAAAVAAV